MKEKNKVSLMHGYLILIVMILIYIILTIDIPKAIKETQEKNKDLFKKEEIIYDSINFSRDGNN